MYSDYLRHKITNIFRCYKTFYYFCTKIKEELIVKSSYFPARFLGVGCWLLGVRGWLLGAGCWLLGVGFWLMAVGCSGIGDETKPVSVYDIWHEDSAALRIAVMPTIDCLPLFVAKASGMFESQGIEVSLYPYEAQMDCDTAFCSGWVECMASDLVRTEYLKQKGIKIRYLTATELHWQLLASKMARVRKLSQLEDKMIAMTRYSATALLADKLVDSSKVVNEHVFRIQVNDVNLRLKMLESQVMDAMLLPEPQATGARLLDAALLYDTHWNDVCLGVLAVSETASEDTLRSRQIEGLLKAYDEACDSINIRGLQAYRSLISQHCGVKPSIVDSLSSDIRFMPSHQPRQQDVDLAVAWLNKDVKVKKEKEKSEKTEGEKGKKQKGKKKGKK